MMSLHDAIMARHSVRSYKNQPIPQDVVDLLMAKVKEVNDLASLHVQLVLNEPNAFRGLHSYGAFRGVANYFVMVGRKAPNLDERVGYYGEQLVLLAQQLGLNTCWVGLTFSKTKEAFVVGDDEKLVCVIALGYGQSSGATHRVKSPAQVSNISETSPDWFRKGVDAALLCPTAVNQQKFHFELTSSVADGLPIVRATKSFSLVGFAHLDLGIAKLHFEIAAGTDNFRWAD